MQQAIKQILVLLLAIMLPVTHLGAAGASSPEPAYRQYIGALYRADPDQVLAVITGEPEQLTFIRAFIDCVRTSNAFREKYITAYGQVEWDRFAQDETGAEARAFQLPGKLPIATYHELLKRKPVQQGRDFIVRGEAGDLRIILQEGQWYMAADTLGFEGRTAQYEILAAVLREYKTRIGSPGVSPSGLRIATKRAIRQTGMW